MPLWPILVWNTLLNIYWLTSLTDFLEDGIHLTLVLLQFEIFLLID